jgi:uncharacterized membrane protein YkoI
MFGFRMKKEKMMTRYMTLLVMTMAVLTAGASLAAAAPKSLQENKETQEQERLKREAKISMDQAREIALKRAPGTVESGELEREHGKIVYSFDIRNSKGTIDEVQVSAITGKVVRVEHENKKQEAAEKRKESKEKHKP